MTSLTPLLLVRASNRFWFCPFIVLPTAKTFVVRCDTVFVVGIPLASYRDKVEICVGDVIFSSLPSAFEGCRRRF